MPYIGNDLATQFQAFATQTITGDGSTGYTLDRAVANGKEILVYINNVKQEEGSGKAYTASGTTITFSEAVASGDSCYLVYMGSAQQTVTPPAGSLGGYTGNASLDGAVTINESSADVDFRVESNDDTHALFVDAGNNKVAVGTSSPNAKLAVSGTGTVDLGIGSTNAGGAYLYLDGDSNGDFSGSDQSYIGHDTSGQLLIHQDSPSGSDNILLKTNGSTRWTLNSSGNLFPAATSQGIVLGATSDTAANRLDDYEEGTFTATMANSVTLTSNYDSLAYTKIGRQVTVTGQIQINSDNSNSHTVITNLPFTHFTQSSPNEDADRAFCAVRLYNHDAADDAQFVGAFTAENTTNLYFVNVRDNAANADLEADASGYLMFTITYFSTQGEKKKWH